MKTPRILLGAILCGAFLAGPAAAQTLRGYIGGVSGDVTLGSNFTCTGSPTCSGTIALGITSTKCSTMLNVTEDIVFTGVNVAAPGTFQGTVTLRFDFGIEKAPDGTCIFVPEGTALTGTYTAVWTGSQGTLAIDLPDPSAVPPSTDHFTGTFIVENAVAPVFNMTVTGSIDANVGNIRADIQFRPEDVGKSGNVYAFALAPATIVRGATAVDGMPLRMMAKQGKADTAVACVLAQLNASGQLQQVSASGMAAYASGVLSAAGQSVVVLNNVPTVQIAGATFFVGYGASAAAMLADGVNRRVATAPGSIKCEPQPPQTGWWWNPAEPGRGFSMEVRGNTIFFASFLYDASGRSTWLAASGRTSLDGSLFTGSLLGFAGGQALDAPWRARGPAVDNGALTLAFNDATHGTLVWPGGSFAIERFDIVANGHTMAPAAGQPEAGWWWNPQEDGRGFFLEWQGGRAFVAGYMYDAAGNPVWYLTQPATPNPMLLQGSWELYANGQPMGGAYRAPVLSNGSVAPVTITFQGPDSGLMTLPGGRTTAITRFRF